MNRTEWFLLGMDVRCGVYACGAGPGAAGSESAVVNETSENAWAIRDMRSSGESVDVILSTSDAERMRRSEDNEEDIK
jgi:hypothetical protein